jgi:predicted LPLAT superfamily acyltransferase
LTPGAWHVLRERGTGLSLRLVVGLYRLLGRRVCSLLVLPVMVYFFVTGGGARRASRQYLARLHAWSDGRLPRGRPPGWWDGLLHFRQFGLNILDRVAFCLGARGEFDVVVHGREHLTALRDAGQGAVLVSAHLGSFDALRLYSGREGATLNVLMFVRHAPMINALFKQLDPSIDLRMITPDFGSVGWLFDLRERVAAGELVGILGDRLGPSEGHRTSRLPFLGAPAPFSHGAVLMAHLLRCPLLMIVGLRRDHRTYEVFVDRLAERVVLPSRGREAAAEALLETYVRRLEGYCARAPYQWFNFYDFWSGAQPAAAPAGAEAPLVLPGASAPVGQR